MTTRVDTDNQGCQNTSMTTNTNHEAAFQRIRQVRAEAIEHTRKARELHDERRALMLELVDQGVSQSDIARELGVTRQAVQKMMAV
jgi:DNA invertase Pin-like site-specific DNA recombinase